MNTTNNPVATLLEKALIDLRNNCKDEFLVKTISGWIEAALAATDPAATQPVGDAVAFKWRNGCDTSVPDALRYLARYPRPSGGESHYNEMHLMQLADEIESAVKASRNAPPAPVQAAPDAVQCPDCKGQGGGLVLAAPDDDESSFQSCQRCSGSGVLTAKDLPPFGYGTAPAAPIATPVVTATRLAAAFSSLRWMLNKSDECDTPDISATELLDETRNESGHTIRQDLEFLWENAPAVQAAPVVEKLPRWIDDAKGKDPFTDDLIAEIIRLRATPTAPERTSEAGELPPLPKPFGSIDVYRDDGGYEKSVDGFTADQMRGYAIEDRAARQSPSVTDKEKAK